MSLTTTGAGGADRGLDRLVAVKIDPCEIRNVLGCFGDLIDFGEAHVLKTLDNEIRLCQMIELPEQRRRGQRDEILGEIQVGELIVGGVLRGMLAYPDTFAAVDTLDGVDLRLVVPDADGFRGTAAEARRTARAFFGLDRDCVGVFCHIRPSLSHSVAESKKLNAC